MITFIGEYQVRVNGRLVGTIKEVKDGWQYYHNDSKTGGTVYLSLAQCKYSLRWVK